MNIENKTPNINTQTKKINMYTENKPQLSIQNLLEYKISVQEIVVLVITLGFIILIYNQNQQITELTNAVQLIADSHETLKQELVQKDIQLKTLENAFNSYSLSTTAPQSSDVLKANNEMTPFYIKVVSICVASLLAIYFIKGSLGVFSLKAFLPASVHSLIQNYTPFLREIAEYSYIDSLNDTIWFIKITNNKKVELFAKFLKGGDYQEASKFLESIMSNSGSIVPYVKPLLAESGNTLAANSTLLEARTVAEHLANFM